MALSKNLARYLEMERLMLSLEGDNVPAADTLRDLMDPLWYLLTEDERTFLDNRSVSPVDVLEWVSVPLSTCLFERTQLVQRPIIEGAIKDWKTAA